MTRNLGLVTFFIVLLVISYQLSVINPALALEVDLVEELGKGITSPEMTVTDESIAAYIVRFYWFAVGAAGIVAVTVIVGGAIYYMTSSGSPDKQNDAKNYITSALWGVALLLGSYLILNTINPQITALKPPGGDLPSCSEVPDGKPGIDCLPEVPRVLPTCTGEKPGEEPGENCLPACLEGESACGIGEIVEEGKDCVECAYAIKICPTVALPPTCLAKIEGINGTISGASGSVSGGIPDCDSCARDWPSPPGTDPEFGTKWLTVEGFENGTILQYGAYPEEKEPSDGLCIIYAYTKTEEDTQNNNYTESDLDGLKPC